MKITRTIFEYMTFFSYPDTTSNDEMPTYQEALLANPIPSGLCILIFVSSILLEITKHPPLVLNSKEITFLPRPIWRFFTAASIFYLLSIIYPASYAAHGAFILMLEMHMVSSLYGILCPPHDGFLVFLHFVAAYGVVFHCLLVWGFGVLAAHLFRLLI